MTTSPAPPPPPENQPASVSESVQEQASERAKADITTTTRGIRRRSLVPAVALILGVAGGATGAYLMLDPTTSDEYVSLDRTLAETAEELAAVTSERDGLQNQLQDVHEAREAEEKAAVRRSAELDEREVAVKAREDAVTDAEEAAAAGAAAAEEAAQAEAAAGIANGIYLVGTDIQPGQYRTEGGSTCYWARLSGTGGSLDDIIANGLPDGPGIVTIEPSDVAFESTGCANWKLIE